MPSPKKQNIRHTFGGGWARDFGPTVDVVPDESGKVIIPFLWDAENTVFELDGGPRKIGGTTKVNSSELESGATVTGVFDYWKQGTSGTESRRRICHVGTKVLADNDDANFSSTLATGLETGKVPDYCVFDDLLIYCSDSTADVPRSWDQTTSQALAGSPPNFSFCVEHKNRVWAAGVATNPSRLYYCANLNPEDWVGVGSGFIDISPSDGDMITGIVSHKDELWVFKGPNKGSIHRISGSAPTGSDGFARKTFVRGLGAAWHNAIFNFADDIGFVSQYGAVHSLSSTAAFGDFFQAALSKPLNIEIGNRINYTRLRFIQTANDTLCGCVFITLSFDGATTNNVMLIMDYRNGADNIRWSYIPAYQFASISQFVDTNGIRRILGGDYAGFVRRLNIPDRSIDATTSYNYKITTPNMNYGFPIIMKTLENGSIGIQPRGDFDFTFGWTRDAEVQQTVTIAQGGGDVLGTVTNNQFTLGTSTLGGSRFVDVFHEFDEEGDEFRSVSFQITQGGLNEDIEVHSIAATINPSGESTEN